MAGRRHPWLLGLLALPCAAALVACGGDDTEEAFGVEIDRSSPEGVVRAYIALIDTCDQEAAERAFELVLQPEFVDAARAGEIEDEFGSDGFCEGGDEPPPDLADRLVLTPYTGTDPFTDQPLADNETLIQLEGTDICSEGGGIDAVVATEREGEWWVNADETADHATDSLLVEGCIR